MGGLPKALQVDLLQQQGLIGKVRVAGTGLLDAELMAAQDGRCCIDQCKLSHEDIELTRGTLIQ